MKNIKSIIKTDILNIKVNVVAIVILFGLCVVPCLYAWFNIFSNWDPYGKDATSKLSIAVYSEDQGADLLGLELNAGQQLVSGLKANDSIGWSFVDTKDEAIEGLYSSKYYAAIIVPKDFSENCISFLTGELKHPNLEYFENDKKNAVAPQITNKAKNAVKDEINTSIVEALTEAMTKVVYIADANGIDVKETSINIAESLETLKMGLSDTVTVIDACSNLSDASKSLLIIGNVVTNDVNNVASSSGILLDNIYENLNEDERRVPETVSETIKALDKISANLVDIRKSLNSSFNDVNNFIAITTGGIVNPSKVKSNEKDIIRNVDNTIESTNKISKQVKDEIGPDLLKAIKSSEESIEDVKLILESLNKSTENINAVTNTYLAAIEGLSYNLSETRKLLNEDIEKVDRIQGLFENLANNENFNNIISSVLEDGDLLGEYIAAPIKMNDVVIYKIESYGSAMAAFYTVLAQWVGAILCAVLIKTNLHRKDLENLKLHEHFFGRYAAYLFVGISQGFIVAIGDLYYCQIQCLHPWKFMLVALVTGLCFSMINYALVFALDNVGLAASVIMLVIQVAGAGGTFPVQLLPKFFQILNPYMPFVFAMNGLKECIAGSYEHAYSYNVCMLLVTALIFMVLGLALYYPALKINKMVSNSMAKSNIMN